MCLPAGLQGAHKLKERQALLQSLVLFSSQGDQTSNDLIEQQRASYAAVVTKDFCSSHCEDKSVHYQRSSLSILRTWQSLLESEMGAVANAT